MTEANGDLCFQCHKPGHYARSCPDLATDFSATEQERSTRPEWCGECDKQTRLIDYCDHMKRCPRCWAWPERGTYPKRELPQHQRCGGCGRRIYAWDASPCGKHQNLAYTGLS